MESKIMAGSASPLRGLLNSLTDGVVGTDLGGRVTFINRAAEQLLGCKDTDAIGSPLTDVFRIFLPSGEPAELFRVNGAEGSPTVMLSNRGGMKFPIEARTVPIRDSDGSLAGVVITFREFGKSAKNMAEASTATVVSTKMRSKPSYWRRLDGR